MAPNLRRAWHPSSRLSPCLAVCALALLTGCHTYAPPTPLSQLDPQQSRGHAVFQARCSQCHYDHPGGALHGPSVLAVFQKPYLHSGTPANDERVTATILHGHNLMPAQPDLDPSVSPGDLDDLLAYLHTL